MSHNGGNSVYTATKQHLLCRTRTSQLTDPGCAGSLHVYRIDNSAAAMTTTSRMVPRRRGALSQYHDETKNRERELHVNTKPDTQSQGLEFEKRTDGRNRQSYHT